MGLTIAQAAERCGLTAHTLRYYDREGLLPFVDRTPAGARTFKEEDFAWLRVIACLKGTGMQVKQIRQYIDWCLEGDGTKAKRLEMFRQQKREVERQVAELNSHMEMLDHKIAYYEQLVAGGHPGDSDAIVKKNKSA